MNVESLFGNYAEGVKKDHIKLSGILSDKLAGKYGVTWNAATGEYESDDPNLADKVVEANKKTDSLRTRWSFRNKQINKQKDIKKELTQIDKDNALAGKSSPGDKARAGSLGRRPGSGSGPTTQDSQSKGEPSAGQTGGYSYDGGGREGYGYGLKKGGRAGYFFGGRVNYKVGGRVNFKNGGLASIL